MLTGKMKETITLFINSTSSFAHGFYKHQIGKSQKDKWDPFDADEDE